MSTVGLSLVLCLLSPGCAGQGPNDKAAAQGPSLPVIDENACPFEGCTFGKWIVARDSSIFSSWKEDRKPISSVKKGEVVAGLTGVPITYEPDHIQVLKPNPELRLHPGDTILRYMYRGEGFADIWVKGEWKKEYHCSFTTEKDGSGCLRECSAKVISEGRRDWWVRLKTKQGSMGWTKEDGQFDCMDSLGGDPSAATSNPSAFFHPLNSSSCAGQIGL